MDERRTLIQRALDAQGRGADVTFVFGGTRLPVLDIFYGPEHGSSLVYDKQGALASPRGAGRRYHRGEGMIDRDGDY